MPKRLFVVGLVVSISGCSAIGVRGSRSRGLACTPSVTPVIVDAVMTVGGLATLVGASISASRNCKPDMDVPCFSNLLAVPAAIVLLGYGISLVHGISAVGECRAFRRSEAARSDDLLEGVDSAAVAGDCRLARKYFAEASALDTQLERVRHVRTEQAVRCLNPGAPAKRSPAALPTAPAPTVPAPTEPAPREGPAPAEQRRASVAHDMILEAKQAARAGDCDAVKRLDPRIRAVDPDQHQSVFLADAVIAKCLSP